MFEFSATLDVGQLLDILWRRKIQERVHHIEHFYDLEVIQHISDRFELSKDLGKGDQSYPMKLRVKVYEFLGSDVFRLRVSDDEFFKLKSNPAKDTAGDAISLRERNWIEEHIGPIQNWDDFENLPWPQTKNIDFSKLEWMEKNLSKNMGCFDLTVSILEMLT